MNPATKKAFQNITDCFTGIDGCERFVIFRSFVYSIDDQAEKGDVASKKIIEMVKQFSKMIDVAQTVVRKKQ